MKYALAFILAMILITAKVIGAETNLAVTTISETSAVLADLTNDTTNGNKLANPNGDLFVVLYNGGADTNTATFTAQKTSHSVPGYGTMTKSNNTVTLLTGARQIVGPFRSSAWNNSTGYVILNFAGTSSNAIKVSPLRVPVQ